MATALQPAPSPAPYTTPAPALTKAADASVARAAAPAIDSLQSAQQFLATSPATSVTVTAQRKELTANLALAKETKDYVLESVPLSPNYLERLGTDFTDELKANGMTMQTFHGAASSALEAVNSQHAFEEFNEAALLSIAATAVHYKMGTCLEMSAAGYAHLQKKTPGPKVEIFMIDGDGGNHVFLVIGRDPKSKPEDYKNWGLDAVVCDPWGNASYPAAEIEKNLRNFKELQFEESGHVRTVFSPFKPSKQTLSLLLK